MIRRTDVKPLWTIAQRGVMWRYVSAISNPDFKVMIIIQRQITKKWYKIELHLQRPTNRKSHGLSNGAIFNDLLSLPYDSTSARYLCDH